MALDGRLKTGIARCWSGARKLVPGPPKLTVLYYHAVAEADVAAFERQMAWLANHANLVHADHAGELDRQRPNVAVTFDDAFESVAINGLPAIIRHRIPVTIFVPTGWLGRPPGWQMESEDRDERVMDAAQLRGLPRGQVRFGSHTVDHPRLSTLTPAERERQLVASREMLEIMFESPIDTLAFPYGDHDQRTIDQARLAGYRHVFTILPEAIRPEAGAISRGRTAVAASDDLGLFALKARGAFEWMPIAIRAKRIVRQITRR